MENAILQRINAIIELKSLSQSAFAKYIGASQKTINQQLKGERSLSLDTINKIISSFEDVSPDWLLTGTLPMLKSAQASSQHIQNRDGNIVAGGSVIVPSHYGGQKIAEKKEGKLLEVKAELSGLKQENERLKVEVERLSVAVNKSNQIAEALRGEIESLKKENAELHKQLIEEKERLISILMEKKCVAKK